MKLGFLILAMANLLAALASSLFAQSFRIPLRVAANSGAYDSLWFGVDTSATYCIDAGLGEGSLPPAPPSETFDARFVNPRSGSNPSCFEEGTLVDIRPYVSTTQIDTYKVRYQPGAAGSPVLFSWPDINSYYTNSVWLRSPIDGSIVNVNMKTDSTYLEQDEGILYIVTGDPVFVPQPPSASTGLATFVTGTSSRLHGSVNPNEYSTMGWFEWGTTTGYGNSTTPQSLGSGNFSTSLIEQISGLSPGTAYHYRCIAQNVNGTTYGNDQSFATILDTVSQTVIPIHVTDNYTDLITVWAGVHPSATFCLDPSLGEEALPPIPPSGTFDVRLVYPRLGGGGQCFDQGTRVDLRPYIGSSQVDTFRINLQSGYSDTFAFTWPNLSSFFNDPVRLLDPYGGLAVNVDMKAETTYTLTGGAYIPALLVVAGLPASMAPPPAVMTNPPGNIVYSSAQLDGITNPLGFDATGWFEWGTTTNYGNTTPIESLGNGSTIVPISEAISGLSPGTLYHYRVVAQNSNGIMVGPNRSFTTLTEVTTNYGVTAGWNMISLPMTVGDGRKTVQFPTATSNAFGFQNGMGYIQKDTLASGEGYWLKFGSAGNVPITGVPVSEDTFQVVAGWNLIGSITNPIDAGSVIQIPPGILLSPFFEYNGSYSAVSTLNPAKAYWVKSGADGLLMLSSNFEKPSVITIQKPSNSSGER